MILYHGTNKDFDKIDFSYSLRFKDFGKGFYLTDIRSQALDMARRKVRLDGGAPFVQKYEFNQDLLTGETLRVLHFEEPSAEWAEFIFKNRNRRLQFSHDYDIVCGPVADDGVAYLLNLYEDGLRTLDDLAKELRYKHLNSQYCFSSEKSIQFLKRIL